jgi:CheY-like chemotaxis protein
MLQLSREDRLHKAAGLANTERKVPSLERGSGESAPVELRPEGGGPATVKLNVLHVDDDPMNLWVVEDVLGAFGHKSIKAEGSQAGLEALASRAFDVVLMDIHMPGVSGIEVVQRLRRGDGPNRSTPVIALTADVLSRSKQDYLALGFNDYVSKPILVSRLLGAITRAAAMDGSPSLSALAAVASRS